MPPLKQKRKNGRYASEIEGKNRNLVMRVYPDEKDLLLKLRDTRFSIRCVICKQKNFFNTKSLEDNTEVS